jgi:hypothetical protein
MVLVLILKWSNSTPFYPNFKPVEFDGLRKQAGLNSFTKKL